ncbi:MAG: MBL fold metallo-hydrolase [Opitutales bacterium]|nr:MBL fold metallo-hydrolase [Opitutales bacterium]
MELIDLNPSGGIGANALYLQIGPFRIVVDAGIHPKLKGREALPNWQATLRDPLDLIVLTHCHLDHLGAIPLLAKDHPATPVVMSPASHLLFPRMLQNSVSIMRRQRSELGTPLFSRREVEATRGQAVPLHPRQPRFYSSDKGEQMTLTLFEAGHIPGTCGVMFEYRHRKIFHTSDVLFEDQCILSAARFPREKVDTLIMETTRGATERPSGSSRESEIERLLETIRNTVSHGGSVLIPAFALGRMQELLAIFHLAKENREFPDVPLYVSGLGLDLVDYFDQISRGGGNLHFRRRVLKDLGAQRLPESHKAGSEGPAIYLVSSGMMVAHTPSYNTAASLLGNHRNAICFVGYCDPDTPGGELLQTRQGERYLFEAIDRIEPVKAHIDKFDLSSHANREDLLEFACELDPRAIVLTHGDQPARDWFREQLSERLPDAKVFDPQPLKRILV